MIRILCKTTADRIFGKTFFVNARCDALLNAYKILLRIPLKNQLFRDIIVKYVYVH